MRRLAALPAWVGLLTAFVMAPFQHVHTGTGADHGHTGLIHAHFYNIAAPRTQHTGHQFDDDDDHQAIWAVDTFTLVLTAGITPFIPSRGPALLFIPSPILRPVVMVEECGHDPPSADPLIPRAPPA